MKLSNFIWIAGNYINGIETIINTMRHSLMPLKR